MTDLLDSQSVQLSNLKMLGITKGLVDYIRRRKNVFEALSEKDIEESLLSLAIVKSMPKPCLKENNRITLD